MKKFLSLMLVVTVSMNAATEGSALAMSAGSTATSSGIAMGQLGQIAESAGNIQSFQPDLFTGRAQTGFPIFVPPGRKNVQPSLNLSYSSSGGNGWLGIGWALDLGWIQRDTKNGVPKYDSTDKYIFSFQGVSSELVSVATNEYRAKDEALFLKFTFDSTGNTWTVTDKSGTKHFFGVNSGERLSSSLGTFRWALSKVQDTSGNWMALSYTTDGGNLYLASVDYNGNVAESFDHTHKVEFTLEDRSDNSFSYQTGAKVETNKRLKEIEVKVIDNSDDYQPSRKYTFGYETSAATGRSRLSTVTEYVKDSTTPLPVTTFVYQNKELAFDFMADFSGVSRASGSSNYDFVRSVTSSSETLADLLDMNGDAKIDRLQAVTGNTSWKVQLGGSSFGTLTDFGTLYKPTSWAGYDYLTMATEAREQATDISDINADGLPDRIIAQDANTAWTVQLNNGTGFESSNSSWSGIQKMVSSVRYDYVRYSTGTDPSTTLVDFFDINGDGYPDRVMSVEGTTHWKVQLNTGSAFSAMQTWGTTERMTSLTSRDAIRAVTSSRETYVDVIDMNGDGMPDRLQAADGNSNWKIQWNTGSGFTAMEDFGPVVLMDSFSRRYFIRHYSDSGEQTVDLFDINGDGLPDRVQATDSNTVWKVQFNTGTGFTSIQDFGTVGYMQSTARYSYPRWTDSAGTQAVDVADIDGDGLPDRIQSESSNTAWKVQKNKGPYPDLLKEIRNGKGGKTVISYAPSSQYDNTDTNGKHRLPFPVQTVSQVQQHDGMNNVYTTTYSYKGGMYDATKREFRGFREVTVTDAVGTKTIHTFGQDNLTKGRLLKKEVRDAANNLFSKEETTWDDVQPWGGSVDVTFVYVTQVDAFLYDGDSSYKQTRQTFTYDDYGNLASTTEQGDLEVTGDERKTVNTYVYAMSAPGSGSGTYIVNTLSKTTLYDADLTTIKAERYFYYDGATAITTAPTAGLLTKEEEWLNTASGCSSPGTCTNNPKTTMTYDDFGNVETVEDARGATTTNTYESKYKLFLTQIVNELNHTRQFTYDYWLAQILTSTDQNGRVTETVYDTLGRVNKVIAPLDSTEEPTQEFTYTYPDPGTCGTNCVTKVTTKVKSSKHGETPAAYLITYSFSDGLGREIQRRSPAEDPEQQIISGIVTFNNRGLVAEQYVPYFEDSAEVYTSPVTSTPKAEFTYDAVGRRTRIDYPDATYSTVSFSDFVKTTTDPRGKDLRYTNDAYGRLVKVEEFNEGSTYTTTYEYDVLNNLKKTTDNQSNQTTITYDSLSRKTGMNDPDMGADIAWSYTYDLNDNLASQTDAKGQVISFTYDVLNRVTFKDLPGDETDVVYVYDIEPETLADTEVPENTSYRTGRLTQVTDASGTHAFAYDAQGRVIMDRKVVDLEDYDFIRTYDAMGRVRTLTYPDSEVVTYTYNGFGDIETISGVKATVPTDYVKDVNYNPSGQITYLKYGNNVTSNYTYDSDTLRLENILTKKPDNATKLQDLSYTFDANGNVSGITDAVNARSQTFSYDDLNRLISASAVNSYGLQEFSYDSIGNMLTKAGRTMTYGAGAAGPHAVTEVTWSGSNYPTFCRELASGSCTQSYDANGNMITRGSDTLAYDSENRLKEVKNYEGESGATNYVLKAGWNVISFPHLPDNKSVTNVLSTLTFGTDYDQVSTWDSASGSWKHWVGDSDFNDFTEFEYGKTYEIYNKSGSEKTFTVTGRTRSTDITHNIVAGDNFISPALKDEAVSVTTVLSGLSQGTHYSDVKRYNAEDEVWESLSSWSTQVFEPGVGYNIIGLTNASFSYGKTETTTTFVYDSTGARVKKTAGGETAIYLGKDFEVDDVEIKHIFLGDRRITTKKSSGEISYIHDDHISSSNVVTKADGDQSAMYEYDPYGATVTDTGDVDLKHQFTGQEKDDSTGLHYYNARYYDSQLGRFITADPTVQHATDPQDLNRYAYARNNPIKYTDPTGLGFWKKFIKVFAISVAVVAVAVLLNFVGLALATKAAVDGIVFASYTTQIAASTAVAAGATGAAIGTNQIPSGQSSQKANYSPDVKSNLAQYTSNPSDDGELKKRRGTELALGLWKNLPSPGLPGVGPGGGAAPAAPLALPIGLDVRGPVQVPQDRVLRADEPRSGQKENSGSQGNEKEQEQKENKPPGDVKWSDKVKRWVDDNFVYTWDKNPHLKRGGGPHWDRGSWDGKTKEWSSDGITWHKK